jgi:hypothetical protein
VNQHPVYRLSGDYFGFVADECLFDLAGEYVGWLDGSDVWRADGTWLGRLALGVYVVRPAAAGPRAPRDPRPAPEQRPTVVVPPAQLLTPWGRAGYVDALDGL